MQNSTVPSSVTADFAGRRFAGRVSSIDEACGQAGPASNIRRPGGRPAPASSSTEVWGLLLPSRVRQPRNGKAWQD